MRLEPLYRLTFRYPESFDTARERFLLAEGRSAGRVEGRFRGANRALRLPGDRFLPDLNGAITSEDGATILVRATGLGEPRADPRGRVVAAITHSTDDERYRWLDGAVCAAAGEVRDGREIVLDVARLVWEPLDYDADDAG